MAKTLYFANYYLAFVLDYRLSLYEHQSTHNPNIPLRDLFYISSEYQKMVTNKSLYASTPVFVPTPHFVVLYNGTDKRPEREIMKLSDLYNIKENEPMLELQVLVLNINKGYNEKLKRDCRTLNEYMVFVDRVNMYRNEGWSLDEAVNQAVDECIDEGILKDFLLANKAEVIAVSIFEFDEEKEWRLFGEAEREAGREEGREVGREEGREEGRKELMISLVKDGILSISEASARINITEEELKEYI